MNERMSVNSGRRMHTFVELGVESGIVRLSWTTALWHGVVVHHHNGRVRPANRGQPLQKIMAAIYPAISSEPCIVFLYILW